MGEPGREKAGAGVAFGLILVLLVLCGGGYAAAYVGSTDRVPRDTTIAGVDVGGLSPSAAEAALRRGLAERSNAPVGVVVDGQAVPVTPSEAGLGVDYAASVRQAATGRSWRPERLWRYYTGGDRFAPVTTFDRQAFDEWLAATDTRAGRPPREGAVYFDGTRIATTQPLDGLALAAAGTRRALRAAYAASLSGDGGTPVDLPTVGRAPAIDQHDVDRALRDFANPAMSGPVTLVLDEARLRFSPDQYADALSLVPRHGRLRPTVDRADIDALVRRAISGTAAPIPATVALVHGRPKVVPDKPGVSYHARDVAAAFGKVVARPEGHRSIKVPARSSRSDFRTQDARALRIRQKVSSFTTYFPYADYRNTNIGRAAQLVDGTVLKPGQTFSLNDTVGKRTRRNGFTKGFVISDGVYAQELGGGVSQLATTIFNAMFFAGLEDVEHKPHSFYIDRYPVGREATVAWGSVDLRFRNDTPYGVLISAHVTPSTPSRQGVVTVSMWSTRTWDITTSTGDRYNRTPPRTRVLHTEDCYPNDGYAGFDVDVTRYFHEPGRSKVDHSETFHTRYIPADTVVCRP